MFLHSHTLSYIFDKVNSSSEHFTVCHFMSFLTILQLSQKMGGWMWRLSALIHCFGLVRISPPAGVRFFHKKLGVLTTLIMQMCQCFFLTKSCSLWTLELALIWQIKWLGQVIVCEPFLYEVLSVYKCDTQILSFDSDFLFEQKYTNFHS